MLLLNWLLHEHFFCKDFSIRKSPNTYVAVAICDEYHISLIGCHDYNFVHCLFLCGYYLRAAFILLRAFNCVPTTPGWCLHILYLKKYCIYLMLNNVSAQCRRNFTHTGATCTHHPYLVMGGCHSDVTMTVVFVHTEVFVSACNHSSYEG